MSERKYPRASVSVGPLTVLWLDLWTNRYGLTLELKVGRHRVYEAAVGYGKGIRFMRGWA